MAQTDTQTGELADVPVRPGPTGSWAEVLSVFLRLGLTSFGGPVAHLGYFRDEFVVRRRWLTDRAYADLVALCQFLPGPASSQVGMAVGLMRAGYPGLLAAWTAFTLPSAIVLVAFAYGAGTLEAAAGTGWIQGLKAAAVAVVAHAVLGMAANLTPDKERATIAVLGMIGAMLIPLALGQVLVILAGGLIGLAWLRPAVGPATEDDALAVAVRPRTALLFLVVFFALLLLLPLLAASTGNSTLRLIDGFYRAGSLVFGGGHVVLPLLQAEVVETGLVDRDAFLAGYGATQAVPGPLFTFSAYLGAVMKTPPLGNRGSRHCAGSDLRSFCPAHHRRASVLGSFAERAAGAARAVRSERGGRRIAGSSALQSCIYRRHHLFVDHGDSRSVVRCARRLENTGMGGRDRRWHSGLPRPLSDSKTLTGHRVLFCLAI